MRRQQDETSTLLFVCVDGKILWQTVPSEGCEVKDDSDNSGASLGEESWGELQAGAALSTSDWAERASGTSQVALLAEAGRTDGF